MNLSRAFFSLGIGLGLMTASVLQGQTLKVLHHFSPNPPGLQVATNSDGSMPRGDLAFSGSTIYGSTKFGGQNGNGVVYSVNLNGTGFQTLHDFAATGRDRYWGSTNADGMSANGVLLYSNMLYGSTALGGPTQGTIFTLNTDGTGFNVLHKFSGMDDGVDPAPILKSGSLIYGSTPFTTGVFFSLDPGNSNNFAIISNTQRPNSLAVRLISGDTAYGTSSAGGDYTNGFVFSMKTNGANFTILHSFGAKGTNTLNTNADGYFPGGLILSGDTLG